MTEALLEPTEWVAHVCVFSGLAHLDRAFDYLVPDQMSADVHPGVRVRVKLAGRLLDGIVLAVDHDRQAGVTLRPLQRVVSAEVVVTAEQLAMARAVAARWAGTLEEVLRWAVPTRHAATEKAEPRPWPVPRPADIPGALEALDDGSQYLHLIARGGRPRAFWRVAPVAGPADRDRLGDWRLGVIQVVSAALESGRQGLCCVPTVAQAENLAASLGEAFGAGTVAVLHADQSTADRWRNYLAVVRGQASIVVGTRSAVLAPMTHLGVIVVWDEGSNLHDDPRAPYPNARDVAALRAQTDQCALLLAGYSCSPRVAGWLDSGWLAGIQTPRGRLRALCAPVRAPGDSDIAIQRDPLATRVRLPDLVMKTISQGLLQGPVLVCVPRPGDLIRPCCADCREPIGCPVCNGPVKGRRLAGGQTELECSWCGRRIEDWSCAHCGGTVVRSGVVGASTTAVELGRSFPSVPVIDSSADHIRAEVGDEPTLVVATPRAEPRAVSGYAAAILLDAGQALARPGLDAVCQVLDHWFQVASLVRSGDEDGQLVVVAPPQDRAVQAMIRNDPVGWAQVEMAERAEAQFPPAAFAALVDGSTEAVEAAAERLATRLSEAGLAEGQVSLLGPVASEGGQPTGPGSGLSQSAQSRLVIRAAASLSAQLVPMLRTLRSDHSLRGEGGPLRVRMNPVGQL